MTVSHADLAKRVQRGAKFLDDAYPHINADRSLDPECRPWEANITPHWLKLDDCSDCILGQLFGLYDDESVKLIGLVDEPAYITDQGFKQRDNPPVSAAAHYGFNILNKDIWEITETGSVFCTTREMWDALCEYWRVELYRRKIINSTRKES